jgi:Holliday junction resolvase RusA-like endonuclease
MTPITFTIPIVPRGQARARHGRTKAGFSVTYKSNEQRQAEENLCALLLPYRPEKPLEGPLGLVVEISMPIPPSWSKKRQEAAEANQELPTGKPDLDNMIKHLKDCLTQVGFWLDDKQVVFLMAAKHYSRTPGWYVKLRDGRVEAEKMVKE